MEERRTGGRNRQKGRRGGRRGSRGGGEEQIGEEEEEWNGDRKGGFFFTLVEMPYRLHAPLLCQSTSCHCMSAEVKVTGAKEKVLRTSLHLPLHQESCTSMLYTSSMNDLFPVYVISTAEGRSVRRVGRLMAWVGIVAH